MKDDVLKRLCSEACSLQDKITKLFNFIEASKDDISDDDFRLLTAQYSAMSTYLFILGIRIKKEKK